MPSQQLFPSSVLPITGDVASSPGSPTVKVQGFQGVPVSTTLPSDQQVYVYFAGINTWVPSSTANNQANKSIQVNGIVMSDDYEVSCNAVLGAAKSPLFVNGA